MDLSGLVPDFPPEWESPVMMNSGLIAGLWRKRYWPGLAPG
jgi:hypothetical protein